MTALPATKNCLDPWTYARITLKGFVAPCCVREPIGTLNSGLDAALIGAPIQALRAALLTGRIDTTCRDCHVQASTDVPTFVRRWARDILLRSKTLDTTGVIDMACHPDVYQRFAFRNVSPGRFGLGDRIMLCPNPATSPPATLHLPAFPAVGGERLQFIVEAEGDGSVEFAVAADDGVELGRVVAGDGSVIVSYIELPDAGSETRLTVTVRPVDGDAQALRSYLYYPVIQREETSAQSHAVVILREQLPSSDPTLG